MFPKNFKKVADSVKKASEKKDDKVEEGVVGKMSKEKDAKKRGFLKKQFSKMEKDEKKSEDEEGEED
jgi:hypothetical protein